MPACAKDKAGAKLLVSYSLKDGMVVDALADAQKTSDIKLWRRMGGQLRTGVLYLFDLAYFEKAMFLEALARGAHVLMRFKTNTKLNVVAHHAYGKCTYCEPLPVNQFLGWLSHKPSTVFDADVIWGSGKNAILLRLVGYTGAEKKIYAYLTTIPRDVHTPYDIIGCYRLRWLIELLFRELKQTADIGRSCTTDPNALMALTYGALVGHALVRSMRIVAATKSQIPLEQLRPIASLRIVAACAHGLIEALVTQNFPLLKQVAEKICGLISYFALEKAASSSRERVAFDLGATGA